VPYETSAHSSLSAGKPEASKHNAAGCNIAVM